MVTTKLVNVAKEPEVVQVCEILASAGVQNRHWYIKVDHTRQWW